MPDATLHAPAAPQPQPPLREPWAWTRWLPLATALGLALAAALWRTCEVDAEADFYHERAEQMLDGLLPQHRFHPFGYVTLLAAMLRVLPDSLLAGCFVSAVASGVLVWSTGVIAAALRPGSAALARLLMAVSPIVWVHGAMASSDMTAAAASTAALALLLQGRPAPRRAFAIGVCLGLATACRYSAGVLVLGIGWWTIVRHRSLPATAALLLGGCLGFLPHAVPAMLAGGSPFANDSWHNLVFKIQCGFNEERLQHLYATGTMPSASTFLREHGGALLARGVEDAWHAVAGLLSAMLAGVRSAMTWCWLWPVPLAVYGGWRAAVRRREAGLLFGLAMLVAAAVAVTSVPRVRLLLPALPLLAVGLAVAASAWAKTGPWRQAGVGLALVVMAIVGTGQFRNFLGEQPEREVAVAQSLTERLPRPFALLSTLPSARRLVQAPVWSLQAPGFASAEAAWSGVRERLLACGADVLLTSGRTNTLLYRQLTAGPPPQDFRELLHDGGVLVVEFRAPVSAWLEASARRTDAMPPRVLLEVRIATPVEGPVEAVALVAIGALLRAPDGSQQVVALVAAGSNLYRQEVSATLPGEWCAQPFALGEDGRFRRGPIRRFVVSPP